MNNQINLFTLHHQTKQKIIMDIISKMEFFLILSEAERAKMLSETDDQLERVLIRLIQRAETQGKLKAIQELNQTL